MIWMSCSIESLRKKRRTVTPKGKWSIREIVGHLIDGERVFGYRAFCIGRGEKQNLPGFDQDDYMLTAPYDHIDLENLLE
jgi:hypothetical protein